MIIEINDRLYNEFTSWAQANNMADDDMRKYIEKAFRDRFTLDKYGDLNEKLAKEEKPKRTRKKSEPKPSEPDNEPICEPINDPIPDKSEQINEQINEDVKPRRKTKVIQSK
jgi:hypothetical protein